ncbi:Cutinase [Clavibacter michiganensis]|uniref:Cutinase n=1 Tax=Clavibacter michiganensis TaxID=28447 RepID=A0A251XY96_9MICO|nr:Cutinase [Clavibacter michiganensis]
MYVRGDVDSDRAGFAYKPARVRHPRRTTGAACLAMAAVFTLVGGPAQAATSGDRCGFVTIIGVRGSGESAGSGSGVTPYTYAQGTGGFGPRLAGVMQLLKDDPNLPVYEEALRYPATIVPNLVDPNYFLSERQGVGVLRAEINSLAANCPSTNIQLAGYSQGAHVIGDVLADKNALSLHARTLLDGVVLFGDPTYRDGERWNADGNGSGHGIFVRAEGAFDGYAKASTLSSFPIAMVRSWCVENDRFCQSGDSEAAHESYSDSYTQRSAYGFLESFLYSAD